MATKTNAASRAPDARVQLRRAFPFPYRATILERSARLIRVELDHGGTFWVTSASADRVTREDTYERAWRDPAPFFDALLARAPVERAHLLADFAPDASTRAGYAVGERLEVSVDAPGAPRLYGLLRRLPPDRAAAVTVELIEACLPSWHARLQEYPRDMRQAFDTQPPLKTHYSLDGMVEHALSALGLLLAADEPPREPGAATRAAITRLVESLEPLRAARSFYTPYVLRDLPYLRAWLAGDRTRVEPGWREPEECRPPPADAGGRARAPAAGLRRAARRAR